MTEDRIAARKRELRKSARALPILQDARAVAQAQRNLLSLEELEGARTVALYAALPGEVPTDSLVATLRTRAVRRVFPRIADGELEVVAAESMEQLTPGSLGVLEPLEGRAISPKEVDVFVVPGMLFDRSGRRLGRGGGHYDRLLVRARAGALRVGFCFKQRLVDELPEQAWDMRMDVVASDEGLLRMDRQGS